MDHKMRKFWNGFLNVSYGHRPVKLGKIQDKTVKIKREQQSFIDLHTSSHLIHDFLQTFLKLVNDPYLGEWKIKIRAAEKAW
jgi:hypothetical protein